jgi:glucokinase
MSAPRGLVAARLTRSAAIALGWFCMLLLAGDIGGTKTELAIYEQQGDACVELASVLYKSRAYATFEHVLDEFLQGRRVDAAGLAVAGPVAHGRCKTTNLPWELDERALSAQIGAPVALSNDFSATVLGIAELRPSDLEVLSAGQRDPDGPIAVLGAGTGLGEALAVPLPNGGLRVLPSEGGHADFAPRDDVEIDLLRFLSKRVGGRVSIERVVSGPGLIALYEYVRATGRSQPDPDTEAEMLAGDAAEVIGRRGTADQDPACARALSLFVSLYGAEAGNLALKILPTGGLFVAGGMSPKLIEALRRGEFMRSMLDKGRMRPLLEQIPVAVVMNRRVALLGARAMASVIYKAPRAC